MTRSPVNERTFKRAMVYSAVFHTVLFTLIALSPSMPKPGKKGMVHYISLGGFPVGGGGSGGGGSKAAAVQTPAKKETLRDLTVASKVKPQVKPSMTYPVDKPKKDRVAKDLKKAAISKPQPNAGAPTDATAPSREPAGAAGSRDGAGSGVRIGLGDGTGGGGLGSGYGDQIGLSDFPYQYYL
ncbi:MAG TPA: hypothetical protein VHP61_04420, partial [Acidobacteriota bacterium]|nr:hypothetical protein [Acidobacteriota bacterium]